MPVLSGRATRHELPLEFGALQMIRAAAEPKVQSCRPKHLYAAYAARQILFNKDERVGRPLTHRCIEAVEAKAAAAK